MSIWEYEEHCYTTRQKCIWKRPTMRDMTYDDDDDLT